MNDVALCANDVLRNDEVTVCKQTAPNDVALRANGILTVSLHAEIIVDF